MSKKHEQALESPKNGHRYIEDPSLMQMYEFSECPSEHIIEEMKEYTNTSRRTLSIKNKFLEDPTREKRGPMFDSTLRNNMKNPEGDYNSRPNMSLTERFEDFKSSLFSHTHQRSTSRPILEGGEKEEEVVGGKSPITFTGPLQRRLIGTLGKLEEKSKEKRESKIDFLAKRIENIGYSCALSCFFTFYSSC